MRKSRAITLTVLSGLLLTGCCLTSLGCGRGGSSTSGAAQQYETPDRTWYDANGNVIPEKWKTDEQGNRVLDAEGRPIPEPVPHDRYHRPWVYSNGIWAPILVPIAHSSSSRSSSWLTGGSGYRSSGTATPYRSGTGSGSSLIGSSSSSSTPSGSSISRGGFGSTGSSSSSSSSS